MNDNDFMSFVVNRVIGNMDFSAKHAAGVLVKMASSAAVDAIKEDRKIQIYASLYADKIGVEDTEDPGFMTMVNACTAIGLTVAALSFVNNFEEGDPHRPQLQATEYADLLLPAIDTMLGIRQQFYDLVNGALETKQD